MKNNYDANYTNKLFIGDLKKSENTFTHERYSFEMIPGTSHELHCSFLLFYIFPGNRKTRRTEVLRVSYVWTQCTLRYSIYIIKMLC